MAKAGELDQGCRSMARSCGEGPDSDPVWYRSLVDLEALKTEVLRRTDGREGRLVEAVPEISIYRHEAPPPLTQVHATGLRMGALLQGEKVVRFEGCELRYTPGSYLVITEESDFESEVVRASPAEPYLALGIELSPETVVGTLVDARLPDEEPEGPDPEPAPAWVSWMDAGLVDVLRRILNALDDPEEQRVLLPLHFRELAFRLLRSDAARTLRRAALRDDDQVRIQRAIAFIRENVHERLSVERIAKHVAMSPSHFAHRFRAVARTSPMQFVKTVRLRQARLLLLSGRARPAEVASRVGYASASHFTRDFKTAFGQPPGDYTSSPKASTAERPSA